MIEYDQGLESNDWFSPHDDSAWRERLGLPDQDAPGTGFDLDDFRVGSLLSLAGPPGVMLLEDSSFAGTISCEHAATFVQGRLVKAAGLDYRQSLQYRLEGERGSTGRRATLPATALRCSIRCSAIATSTMPTTYLVTA